MAWSGINSFCLKGVGIPSRSRWGLGVSFFITKGSSTKSQSVNGEKLIGLRSAAMGEGDDLLSSASIWESDTQATVAAFL